MWCLRPIWGRKASSTSLHTMKVAKGLRAAENAVLNCKEGKYGLQSFA
jgi:hypothetical protein